LFIAVLLVCVQFARADWEFRRPIDANWDPAQSPPTSLAIADFYTAGHSAPDGSDFRVTTDDGTFVASHVLMMGPGDRARVVFALQRPVKKYFIYFGNPTPAVPHPGPGEVKFDCGLLLQMKELAEPGRLDGFDQLQNAWDHGGAVLGETLIPEANIGFNPFGPQDRTVSKVSGSVFAPIDGTYVVSLWADNFAAMYFDGKPVVYAAMGPTDTRNHVSIQLSRGPHELLLYHVNTGGDGIFLAAWKTPSSRNFERIGRQEIATFHTSDAGPLHANRKPITADFASQYMGEAFFADGYSYHYKFTADQPGPGAGAFTWDFGDGQTASGPEVDHVYLAAGVYPIRLTARLGDLSDSQTTRFGVDRLWEHIDRPPSEPLAVHANIASRDDLAQLPEPSLCRAVLLFQRAGAIGPMLAAAARLATIAQHENPRSAFDALEEASREGIASGRGDAVVRFWESVPVQSDLHDRATVEAAELLIWRIGDFDSAVHLLQSLAGQNDPRLKRIYAQALILDQKREEGAKILAALPASEQWEHHVALSGAMARSIEYYIRDKDWATGEGVWDHWQETFPADFLEGYSVLLRTKLMEIKGDSAAAAKVAEAFASAVPGSSYAPQLLDRASRLLASADPAKSAALRQLLKQRYPEDPLSQ
jgi:hypothetical protein